MNYNVLYDNSILWQMLPHERMAFFHVLERVDNGLALEIGSYCGGSLRHLAQIFENTISLDIDHSNLVDKAQYSSVTFIEGDSKQRLPNLISHLNEEGEKLDFVLIDGNHEYEYVMADLENILDYKPIGKTSILIHDSWYPPSRQAILDCSKLRYCSNVEFVDLDFCSGGLINSTTTMGGFCLVQMSNIEREGGLVINKSMDLTYKKLNKIPL